MKVSKSGYCEYIRRRKSNARIERGALEGFAKDAFERHRAGYGYRRINQELRKMDILVDGKRVLHIMRRLGLAAEGATGKRRKQKAVEPGDPRPNTVERVFSVGEKDKLRMGDIVCIPTKEGWLYPACAIGAFLRKAVGRPMPERITEMLARSMRSGKPLGAGIPLMAEEPSSMTTKASDTLRGPFGAALIPTASRNRFPGRGRRWITRLRNRPSKHRRGNR